MKMDHCAMLLFACASSSIEQVTTIAHRNVTEMLTSLQYGHHP